MSQMINLEDKLQLEYYKLQKTFEGAIILKDETGTLILLLKLKDQAIPKVIRRLKKLLKR